MEAIKSAKSCFEVVANNIKSKFSPRNKQKSGHGSNEIKTNDDQERLINSPKPEMSVENFEFLKVLGRGTFGKVLLCREKSSDQLYAMKILKKEDTIKNDKAEHEHMTENRVLQSTQHPFLIVSIKSFYKFTFLKHIFLGFEILLHNSRSSLFCHGICQWWRSFLPLF